MNLKYSSSGVHLFSPQPGLLVFLLCILEIRSNKEAYSLTLDMQELLLYLFCILSGALFDGMVVEWIRFCVDLQMH